MEDFKAACFKYKPECLECYYDMETLIRGVEDNWVNMCEAA